ncbi:MAG: DUF4124 domain-containing protein [Burkholderiales bacterium PBB1]|nr:MAG: DUF4124 domain-containing protein [Burkholderiales bacterium PBB1]
MRTGFVAICGAVLIASLSTPALAQWKWRDKNNQVQYSDLPPPQGVPDSSILQRPPAASRRALPAVAASSAQAAASAASGLAPAKAVEPELEAKLRKDEQDKAAKAKAEAEKLAAQKADNCNRARLQLRGLEDGLRVARVNQKGERELLDDKGRAEEVARTRETISADCK